MDASRHGLGPPVRLQTVPHGVTGCTLRCVGAGVDRFVGIQSGEPVAVTVVTIPPRTCWATVTITGTPTASARCPATFGARCSAKIPRPSNVRRYNFDDLVSMHRLAGSYSTSMAQESGWLVTGD